MTKDEAQKLLKDKVGDKADNILQKATTKRKTLHDIMGVSKKRMKAGEDMEVDAEPDQQEASMDVDRNNMDLRKKVRDRQIKYALSRMEGADPQQLSTKINDKTMDRVRHKIEKKLKKTEQVSFADRRQTSKKPKHLYSGKRGNGKTDRR